MTSFFASHLSLPSRVPVPQSGSSEPSSLSSEAGVGTSSGGEVEVYYHLEKLLLVLEHQILCASA